jgi:uncharacterized membrane protein YeaQ/YmgE (transglycosylase-associated protein family)
MSLLELIVYLIIAALCGSIARAIGGGTRGGFLVSLAVGFVGALVGTWLARLLHLPEIFSIAIEGHRFPVVWSILGGALFVALLSFLARPRW